MIEGRSMPAPRDARSDMGRIDDFLQPESLPALPDKLGIRMLEADSIDRVVDGLKMAADAMEHLVFWRGDETWRKFAGQLDKLRDALARKARNRESDRTPTEKQFGMGRMTPNMAYERVYRGLDMAGKACRQMADRKSTRLNSSHH